jgi:hypothetical protein
MDSDNKNQNENVDDIFDELKDIKKKHPNKFICSYININSFRNKFGFIKDLLISNTCDTPTCMFDRAWVDRYIATDYHNNNYSVMLLLEVHWDR